MKKSSEFKKQPQYFDSNVTITPGQLLLMIIDALYKKSPTNLNVSNAIKELENKYLSGKLETKELKKNINEGCFLESEIKYFDFLLKKITDTPNAINRDSSRRMAETRISFYLLEQLMDKSNSLMKKKLNEFSSVLQSFFPNIMLEFLSQETNKNFINLSKLIPPSLDIEKKNINNVLLIAKLATKFEKTDQFRKLPLLMEIYSQGFYLEKGLIEKIGNFTEAKKNNHLPSSTKSGILRSFDPAPFFDPAIGINNEENMDIQYTCPDRNKYDIGKSFPIHLFSKSIHPFVNSISGTMLCVLRVYLSVFYSQKDCQDNIFLDQKFFLYYLKVMVTTLLALEGGHSLYEFFSCLEISEVRLEIEKIFPDITLDLDNLFRAENFSFKKAIQESASYSKICFFRSQVNDEIISRNNTEQKLK